MKQIASVSYHFRRLWRELRFHGLHVPVDARHVTKPVWKHIWRGDYEAPELLALSALMRPRDRVLELGGGMGLVSGVMAKRNPDARFLSFEANPGLIDAIAALHRRNGISNVEVVSGILASPDQGPTRTFSLHRNFTEGSLQSGRPSMGQVEVPVHDPVPVFNRFNPDVLLCDIEGAEQDLLPILPLGGLRAVVVELHPRIVSRRGMAQIWKVLIQAGLVPVVELSTATVVAFERIDTP